MICVPWITRSMRVSPVLPQLGHVVRSSIVIFALGDREHERGPPWFKDLRGLHVMAQGATVIFPFARCSPECVRRLTCASLLTQVPHLRRNRRPQDRRAILGVG